MFGGFMIAFVTPWIRLKWPVGGTEYGHAEWNSLLHVFPDDAGAVVRFAPAVVGCPAAVVGLVPPGFGVSVALLLLPHAARAAAAAVPAITARKRRRVTMVRLISSLLMIVPPLGLTPLPPLHRPDASTGSASVRRWRGGDRG